MNKIIVIMLCAVVVIGAIFTAVIMYEKNKEETPKTSETKISEENIIDDCTEEYEEIKNRNIIETDVKEKKTSPNCEVILNSHYTKCGHTLVEYTNLPNDLVNSSKADIQKVYQGWDIKEFEPNKITLKRDIKSECGEHYILRINEGKIAIYKALEDGREELYENTEISTEYLPEVDKENMKNGIVANGKQELNRILEDFE